VVSPFSLLALDTSTHANVPSSTSSSTPSESLGISVNTQLVEDLLRKLVIPGTRLASSLVPHGALLLGPPGVGKTYSVRAVKARCRGWCDVHIHELSVSDLLSRDDPLR
jgi:ATP-dependent Zn protease